MIVKFLYFVIYVTLLVGSLALLACGGHCPPAPASAPTAAAQPTPDASPPRQTADGGGMDGGAPTVSVAVWDGGYPLIEDLNLAAPFANQSRDAAWAPQYEKSLRDAVSSFKGAKLRSLECRATLCRLEFSLDSPLSMESIGAQLDLALHKLHHSGCHSSKSFGELGWLAYVCRDGHHGPGSQAP